MILLIENNESDQLCTYTVKILLVYGEIYCAHAYTYPIRVVLEYHTAQYTLVHTNSIVVVKFEHSLLPRVAVGCTIHQSICKQFQYFYLYFSILQVVYTNIILTKSLIKKKQSVQLGQAINQVYRGPLVTFIPLIIFDLLNCWNVGAIGTGNV